jgi:hypothetical protein
MSGSSSPSALTHPHGIPAPHWQPSSSLQARLAWFSHTQPTPSRCGNQELSSRKSPLNEPARNRPSDVMSRYSTSARNFGSTHVAFGFLIGLVSFDFGLTTVLSCFLIWLETVRDQPVPTLPK